MSPDRAETPASPGPGVDREGRPVIDPTTNVLDLVQAAVRRLDDLRELTATHLAQMAELRAAYDDRLRSKEAERIDAIRSVDVAAVQQAATAAETRATALAGQVAASAEAMRNQVAAAATAAATSLAAALVPLQEAIADLRRAQYEAQGQKTQVVETQAHSGNTVALVGAIVGGLVLILLIIGTYASLRSNSPAVPFVVTVTTGGTP